MKHQEYAVQKLGKVCAARHVLFGGRCSKCGYDPEKHGKAGKVMPTIRYIMRDLDGCLLYDGESSEMAREISAHAYELGVVHSTEEQEVK